MNARILLAALSSLLIFPAAAAPVTIFSTGDPDGRMATASPPENAGQFEIESADEFILGSPMLLTGATFTGLLQSANVANIGETRVEIYRVFPNNSDVGRTSGSPTFSLGSFTVANAVRPGGIHPKPGQTTGGPWPEPDSLALLGTALLAIVLVRRRGPT